MADKYQKLKRILTSQKSRGKVPTERPSNRSQRRVFDTFERSANAIFQQSLVGGAERQERFRDYEQMDQGPEISKALDIYADDSTTYDEKSDVLEIRSDDNNIVKELEELYYNRLDVNYHLWTWIRNTCKYGDNFLLLDIDDKEGIMGGIALPVLEIDREEGYNGDPNSVRFKWNAQGNTIFENYQVSHFRILGDDRFLPYGRSILEPARKIWRQLVMAEDAMLIYRMTRAPERRVFYIDVGNIPPKDVDVYMQQARDALKRTPLIQENTGQIDLRYNPANIDEDFYLPVRGDRGSKIDTLPGGQNTGDIEDINYLQNKLFVALGVPKSYLTAEEDLSGKCLSQNTLVALLNGRTLSIKQIAEDYKNNPNLEYHTYTIDENTHKVVPGKILGAELTKRNAKVMRITLDNGEKVECTPNHKFMLRDGSYKEARELEINQSLMPLYRKITTITNIEYIEETVDCYDLQIDNFPNFGLTAGVIVHNSTLAQEDIKHARTIQRIQRIIISELAKIGLIHLYIKGFDEEAIYNFQLNLTNPSTVMESMQLDLIEKRFEIAARIAETSLVDELWIQRNILDLTNEEIGEANARLIDDAKKRYLLDTISQEGETSSSNEPDDFGDFGKFNDDDREDEYDPDDYEPKNEPMKVSDPTGTANLDGVPNFEANDRLISKKIKKVRKRNDPLDRNIADAFKTDKKVKKILENIEKDKENGDFIKLNDIFS